MRWASTKVKEMERNFEVLKKEVKEAVEGAMQHSDRINTSRKSSSISTEIKKIEDRLLKNADKLVNGIDCLLFSNCITIISTHSLYCISRNFQGH